MESESIVLLENRNSVLPLDKNLQSIALIGPQVDRVSVSTSLTVRTLETHLAVPVWRLRLLQRIFKWNISFGWLPATLIEHVCEDQLRARLRVVVER